MHPRPPLPTLLLALLFLVPVAAVRGEEGIGRKQSKRADPVADKAIKRALNWLARQNDVTRDGSFSLAETPKPAPIAVTALATMAFLAHGNMGNRGPFGKVVARGVSYLLNGKQVLAPGKDNDGYFRADNDKYSRTHGHGFATLCLAQAYGMTSVTWDDAGVDPKNIRLALLRAVRFIERIQSDAGGWYYNDYRDPVAHENSVTICMIQALRAARNSGIKVDEKVIARAEKYIRDTQKPDGSFRYRLGHEKATPGLCAAAIATLNMLGNYTDPAIQKGINFLRSKENFILLKRSRFDIKELPWPHYERLYIAQAYWQLPKLEDWNRWYPREKKYLLRTQDPKGYWDTSKYGRVYATAMNLLVLQMNFNYLPIFQR